MSFSGKPWGGKRARSGGLGECSADSSGRKTKEKTEEDEDEGMEKLAKFRTKRIIEEQRQQRQRERESVCACLQGFLPDMDPMRSVKARGANEVQLVAAMKAMWLWRCGASSLSCVLFSSSVVTFIVILLFW